MKLVKDGKVLFDISLSPVDWPRQQLEDELKDFEDDFNKFLSIFDALSNKPRMQMMRMLLEEDDRTVNFADFMRYLDLNPKLVWENARKLSNSGLIEKTGRGKYSCPEFGQRTFMMISLALRRMMETLEELENI